MARRSRKLSTPAVELTRETDWEPSWQYPDSTRVTRYHYDDRVGHLRVEFKDGTPWVYEDVPPGIFFELASTSSVGFFVYSVLDRYPYRHASANEVVQYF